MAAVGVAPLQPRRHLLVRRAAVVLGQGAVGDVVGQGVPEGVLALADKRRPGVGGDEPLPLQPVEDTGGAVRRPRQAGQHLGDRAVPEHPADHGGVLERSALLVAEPVEARLDRLLDGVGEVGELRGGTWGNRPAALVVADLTGSGEVADQLLEEEGVAVAVLDQDGQGGCVGGLRGDEQAEQARRLGGVQGGEGEVHRVGPARRPRRAALQQLVAGGDHDHHS